MSNVNYIYCDSCVFLAYFNGEPGRSEILEQLFDEIHHDAPRKLVTSVFSLVEVAHVAEEKQKRRLRPNMEEILDTFWADTSLIELIDFHEVLARDARSLMRNATLQGHSLRPADALHLASARSLGVAEF